MQVFVNYRQRDAMGRLLPHALVAESLASQLAGVLGEGTVYFDTTLPPGERYADVLRTRIAEAEVVVAVIHPGWLDDLKAREGTHKDWVREEIAEAARTGKKIVPVLLDGAELPRHQDLDDDLRALADAQAVLVRFGAFGTAVAALAAEIELSVAPAERPAVLSIEPLPDRGRLAVALAAAAMLPLLGAVSWCVTAFGLGASGWAVAVFAILPGLPLLVVLMVSVVNFALRRPARWLDDLLGRVTEQKAYVVFGIGVVLVGLVLLLLVVVSAGGMSAELVGLTIVVSVGVLALMGIQWARGQQERTGWPYARVQPRTVWVHAELVELERRLGGRDGWRRPLPMAARRTTRLALDRLDRLLAELAQQQTAGRRAWWRTRSPYLNAVHAGLAAATILVFSAALAVHWSGGVALESGLWWLLGSAVAVACYAGALELAYRTHIWNIRATFERAPQRVRALRDQLAELSTPIPYAAHHVRRGDGQ